MTTYFDPKTNRTFYVGQGIVAGPGKPWFTLYRKGKTKGTHRLISPELPYRDTQEGAQADLDAYARKKGWMVISEVMSP